MLSDALYVKGVEVCHQGVELLFGDIFERGLWVGAAVVREHADAVIVVAVIPHPLGNPALDQEEEKKLRRGIVEKALEALTTEVDGQKVFE